MRRSLLGDDTEGRRDSKSLPLMCQPGASHSKQQEQGFRWDTTCPNRAQSSQEDLLPTEKRWGALGFFVCLFVFLLWFGGFSLFFRLVGLGFSVIYSYDHISSASEKLNSSSQSIFEAKLSISRLQTKIIPKKEKTTQNPHQPQNQLRDII